MSRLSSGKQIGPTSGHGLMVYHSMSILKDFNKLSLCECDLSTETYESHISMKAVFVVVRVFTLTTNLPLPSSSPDSHPLQRLTWRQTVRSPASTELQPTLSTGCSSEDVRGGDDCAATPRPVA